MRTSCSRVYRWMYEYDRIDINFTASALEERAGNICEERFNSVNVAKGQVLYWEATVPNACQRKLNRIYKVTVEILVAHTFIYIQELHLLFYNLRWRDQNNRQHLRWLSTKATVTQTTAMIVIDETVDECIMSKNL